jgi:uncharacterized FAD-dependent dehydrogenase
MEGKKVIVVGAGPAGLFSSYALSKSGFDVTLVEMGEDVEERKEKIKNGGDTAAPYYIQGMGGSGTFSDGKLNLSPEIGGNLLEFTSQNDAERLIDYIDRLFTKYGVKKEAEISPAARELIVKSIRNGIKYIPIKQKHIGSDFLPDVIIAMREELKNNGVEILVKTRAKDIVIDGNKIKGIKIEKNGKESEMSANYVIIAPGRAGSRWLLDLANKYSIPYAYGPLDIGVRIETSNEIMQEVTSINWDPKFHIRTKKYDDFVRTFCTNPSGFVITENYGSFVSVNGHSMKSKKSNNTNFALLVQIRLTEPVENTTLYGESVAKLATTIGGGKAILQRLGDLKSRRRSTWERIERSVIEPTNRDVTPGDISMAMPARIVDDIIEGLDMLAKVIQGINEEHTLIYAPEIKFKSVRLDITNKMETKKIKNLFTAGDGAGVSGGIVTAAATGLIAAREIIQREGGKGEI